ncbi:hypothetical protein QBC47DRAFT_464016 [Echria macrotheca]|uniref:Uncharacterized protein n=1 Tax=Echria macrotheca TaxID=438768 RepID=A0AAJ0B6E6_9PEZI|nr:hypothetical protein QBC47DRAFT_464016 [Echria macrotheca]
MVPVYFLSVGWDIPADHLPVGSIIDSPITPAQVRFRPTVADLQTENVQTREIHSLTSSVDITGRTPNTPFRMFLGLYGLGEDVTNNAQHILSYSITRLRSESIDPTQAFLRIAAPAESDVPSNMGKGSVGGYLRTAQYKVPLFMVTGIKTIKGVSVTARSRKGPGWRVTYGVGPAERSSKHASHHDANAQEPEAVVYAFQLAELKVPAEGWISMIRFDDMRKEDLKKRLDSDFGEDFFKVAEGVDDTDLSECLIVRSGPLQVDLLTASSARIG